MVRYWSHSTTDTHLTGKETKGPLDLAPFSSTSDRGQIYIQKETNKLGRRTLRL